MRRVTGMIYLFAVRALAARALLAAVLPDDDFFALNRLLPDLFFSAPPRPGPPANPVLVCWGGRLRGEAVPSPTNAALTHTTGGSPSMIARHDLRESCVSGRSEEHT